MTNPNVEFVLDTLASVAVVQPTDHPLRRIDRDTSTVYEGDQAVGMSGGTHNRTEDLTQSNLVGVASQSREDTPLGQEYNVAVDDVLSVRVEGMTHREYGHIDPTGADGVGFDALCNRIRRELYSERTYPQHPRFRNAKLDLRITNTDYQSSDWSDYYRREFDVVLRAREQLLKTGNNFS